MKLDVPVSLAGMSIVFISEFRKNIWIVSVFLPHDFYGITDKLRISVKVFPGPEHYMSSINVGIRVSHRKQIARSKNYIRATGEGVEIPALAKAHSLQ